MLYGGSIVKGLIMDRWVLLTATPECVVSPRGETTLSGVDVNNTHLSDNVVDHVVCLKAEFLWHTVLSNENGDFYTYDVWPYLKRSVCLLMESPTWWRFSFCLRGSSLVFRWRSVSLVCEFQIWGRRCKHWDSHWFQGRKMCFCGIWSTMSW